MSNLLRKFALNPFFSIIPKVLRKQFQCLEYHTHNSRRCMFYVPGDNKEKIEECLNIKEIDCIVLDLESTVPADRKHVARENIVNLITGGKLNEKIEWCVQVNSPDTTLLQKDLAALFGQDIAPKSICLPKVEASIDLDYFMAKLEKYRRNEWEHSPVELIFVVESAYSVIHLPDLCCRARHLASLVCHYIPTAIAFNCDEYINTIGGERSLDSMEVLYARQRIATIAKAYHMQAIDMCFSDLSDDISVFQNEAEEGNRMGFSGKQVKHIDHIPVVQKAFTPSPTKVKWAKELLQKYQEYLDSKSTAPFMYNNKLMSNQMIAAVKNIVGYVD